MHMPRSRILASLGIMAALASVGTMEVATPKAAEPEAPQEPQAETWKQRERRLRAMAERHRHGF